MSMFGKDRVLSRLSFDTEKNNKRTYNVYQRKSSKVKVLVIESHEYNVL